MGTNNTKKKGSPPEEDVEDKGEQDALVATESTLQVEVKAFQSMQVTKLIEIAKKVDDPTEALALLQEGLGQFPSLKLQGMSQIDDTLAQPAELTGIASTLLGLKEENLLPAAFSSMSTATLFQVLMDERQRTVGEWANLTKPSLPPDDPATKQVFGEIIDLIEQVGIIHYEIVRAGLFLHVLLSQLHGRWGALRFLASKGYLEELLVRYNAHNPFLGIGIEEQELHGVQTILAIILNMHEYLMSAEFYAYREKKSAPPSPKEKASFGAFSAHVNLVTGMATGSVPEREAIAMKLGKGAKGVFQTSVKFVPVTPVVVDLAETRDPLVVLNDISKAIQGLVDKGMEFIYQLKTIARPVNFNIYTLQFGEATPLQDNRTMMQKMRKDIYTFILKDLQTSTTLLPVVVLKHLFVTQMFAGRYGAGPTVDTVSLDPGEEREITHETTVTTKRINEQSDSVFDAKTTSVKDSLEKSRQNQLQKTATDTTEFTSYLDKTKTIASDAGVSGSYDSKIGNDLLGVSKFSLDANASIAITDGTASGSSQTSNSAREEAVTNTEGMIQNHTEEVGANRERTKTETARQEEELSQKDKEVRKVKNPNRASPMTILFCKLIQNYNTVTSTPGFKVAFMNGSIVTECDIASLQTAIIDKYIKPEAERTRDAIWKFVRASAKVVDYQGRLLDMWDEKTGVPHLRRDYFTLLKEQGVLEVPDDAMWRPYKRQIKGIILSTRQYSLPQCGLLKRATVGDPALDRYETEIANLELAKLKIQNQVGEQPVKNGEALRELVKKILESNPTASEMINLGLLLTPPAEIIQKGTLSAVTGLGLGGNDPTGLEKVKKYLQSRGFDTK